MASYTFEIRATPENFEEQAYLRANPDVAFGIMAGSVASARAHFECFRHTEARNLRLPDSLITEAKDRKLARIRPLLRADLPCVETPNGYDFLSESLRAQFHIVDTDRVSNNNYDDHAMSLIEKHADGLVLDCGAGRRPTYFDNVVNLEIVDYGTTDVRGVGEVLPFVDGAFDAVISIAVLEHVKDPFLCAREIARVLKPGGDLVCCVPFLQPMHGYPHHYYNMTSQGLRNLFADHLTVDRITVYDSTLPIWSLTWILQRWAAELPEQTRNDFVNMKVGDLLGHAASYLDKPFVRDLSLEANLELASATVLSGHK